MTKGTAVSAERPSAPAAPADGESLFLQLPTKLTSRIGENALRQLWYPGQSLDNEYPTPTDSELRAYFADYRPDAADIRSTSGVYGVYSAVPTQGIRAIASIDVDEVIRNSTSALRAVTGVTDSSKLYDDGTWFDKSVRGEAYKQNIVTSVLRVAINAGLVPPMPQINAMRAIAQSWRRQGIYCVANTSTLPGCEPGTIRYALGRDMPGCFDAVLFPRNHYGQDPLTKAVAVGLLASELEIDLQALPIVHIDDTDYHITGFQAAYPDHAAAARLGLFAPVLASSALGAEICCPSPLEAFKRADAFFKNQFSETAL
jgi:hypothetical protein